MKLSCLVSSADVRIWEPREGNLPGAGIPWSGPARSLCVDL
jgi:hypothetical protein